MSISLRYKAALLIALTELALLALLVGTNLYQTRTDLEDQLSVHASSTAELVAASATEALLSSDLAQLQNLLDGVVNKHRVRHVAVRDHRERVLAQAGQREPSSDVVRVARPIQVAGSVFGTVELAVSRTETDTALARIMHSSLLIAGLEVVLVALISLTLGWFLTRHLHALMRGTRAIARGDYAVRVPVGSRDEVGMLATTFNAMADQLDRTLGELERSHRRFRDMADNTSDWLWETDADGRYTYVSKQVEALLGYSSKQVIAYRAFDLMQPQDAQRLEAVFQQVRAQHRPFYGFEYRALRADGTTVTLEANGTPILDAHGGLSGYRGVTRDVTRRKQDESRLLYLAEHDPLTQLWSRQKFLDVLADELRLAAATGHPLTLLFVDLDDFKLINDTYGHVQGDLLLRGVATLLAREAGEGPMLARLGGDEFGLLLRGADRAAGEQLAQRLLRVVERTPLAVNEQQVRVGASIGLCTYPQDGNDSATLLAHADIAMSRAKALGHNRYHVFRAADRDMDSMRQLVSWQTRLTAALAEQRLYLEYQPIVRLAASAKHAHFEALVRLREPDGTCHSAARFIDTAEYTGQVVQLDQWMLRTVLATLASPAAQDCAIAVNLSGRSLGSPGFTEEVQALVQGSAVAPQRLVFELTETAAVAEMAKARGFLATLRALGCRFSLDDFGAGFSSFSYLKHLPVDLLKIDGSFIRHLEQSREDQVFVRAIVQVARDLGIETVAEFVERQETLDLLTDIGVDYVQGYAVGRPGPTLSTPAIEAPRQSAYKRRAR